MRAINADAFRKKLVDRQITTQFFHPAERNEIGCIIDLLDSAPTIDPESLRPQGEWIMRGGKRYCSHCGKRACVTRDSDDFWYTVGTDFCPNCGAKMKGEPDHDK